MNNIFKSQLTPMGTIKSIQGVLIKTSFMNVSVGDFFVVQGNEYESMAQCVRVDHTECFLTPLYSAPFKINDIVYKTSITNPINNELLGRVINALGKPLDGKAISPINKKYSQNLLLKNPLARPLINTKFDSGIKSINTFLTLGLGQRVGIFAGSGVGKSTLLSMISKNSNADIAVIALIGERGREVQEFLTHSLGHQGLQNSVLVVSTSDDNPALKIKAAEYATDIAEYFQEQGKNVVLIMDSLTRYAMAIRELGLAIGEPPTSKGYPPSTYSKLSQLVERAGKFNHGSITGIYTVLSEGDDMQDPIADTVRSYLDGHIVLSRKLVDRGQYPPVDILASVSRLFSTLTTPEHQQLARKIKQTISYYEENKDILLLGGYQEGSDPMLDLSKTLYPIIMNFLTQTSNESFTFEQSVSLLEKLLKEN